MKKVLSCIGTGYRLAYSLSGIIYKSKLKPGETLLVQGSSGGMSTALIQLGRAAGFEVWATSRNAEECELAEKLVQIERFCQKRSFLAKFRLSSIVLGLPPSNTQLPRFHGMGVL
jgi:NADPH:quinone reductase-like Zn-dependent oxidoreductase